MSRKALEKKTKQNVKGRVSKVDLNYTWEKLINFLDICYGKTNNDLDLDEVMSLFLSNFNGEEIIAFREKQEEIHKEEIECGIK